MDEIYTLAVWRVKPGSEAEFVTTWRALADVFARLPNPPRWGRLLQSLDDPALFYSFGPWNSLEDVAAMRRDPHAQETLQKLKDLCTEAAPGAFRVVADVRL